MSVEASDGFGVEVDVDVDVDSLDWRLVKPWV
jgi:hypothetical protein